MKSKTLYIHLFVSFYLFLCIPSAYSAENGPVHIVKEGDTLWSICEKYYGDPFLWPELWEMNKFITNPHWIKPGDEITLLRYERVGIKEKEEIIEREKPSLEKLRGVDISRLTNLKALGFFNMEKAEPWGRIFDLKIELNQQNLALKFLKKIDIAVHL